MTETIARDSHYAKSFPLTAPEDADWTDSVVTQGHVDYCAAYGHAMWTVTDLDGVTRVRDICPRCGEVTKPAAPAGRAPIVNLGDRTVDADASRYSIYAGPNYGERTGRVTFSGSGTLWERVAEGRMRGENYPTRLAEALQEHAATIERHVDIVEFVRGIA